MVISLTSCMGFNRNGSPGEKGEGRGEDLHQDRGRRRDGSVRRRPDAQGRGAAPGTNDLSPGRARRRDRGAARADQSRDPPLPEPPVGSPVRPGTRRQRAGRALRRQVVTVRVATAEQRTTSYDIIIGRGVLADLPDLAQAACPAARYAVITDSYVATLYGEKLVARCHDAPLHAELFAFPAGEASKTRETWASLSDRLLQRQFGRDCGVIALGGGVVGDVAGFGAATYLRGIPYIQVPTTLLAMIDSSIGGKTGVDVAGGKNLLGAFHQPRLVIADLDALGSLSSVQLSAGLAEAVKHGAIADAEYFGFLERQYAEIFGKHAPALERLVRRSVEIKAAIVALD